MAKKKVEEEKKQNPEEITKGEEKQKEEPEKKVDEIVPEKTITPEVTPTPDEVFVPVDDKKIEKGVTEIETPIDIIGKPLPEQITEINP